MNEPRWQDCVSHNGEDVRHFIKDYFSNQKLKPLLIGGAGFDPRTAELVERLSEVQGQNLDTFLIKEERPAPESNLVHEADNNLNYFRRFCENLAIQKVEIFAEDNAVVGGRNVIHAIGCLKLEEYSDVIIDISALSMGVSFPLVLYTYQYVQRLESIVNIHLMVTSNPELDALITSSPNDRVSDVHGFGRRELFGEIEKARLWLPHVSEGKNNVLKMIYGEIEPHDTCPILPFPSENPKKGDETVFEIFSSIQSAWGGPLENEWGLDPRNFLYADERKPLDIYRTILRLDDERTPVFESYGGSKIILSPLGSKIPAIGALMAAMERNFPVVYVESLKYNMDSGQAKILVESESRLAHIWLFGDAYLHDLKR